MIPSPLLRVRLAGPNIVPQFVADRPVAREAAEALVAVFASATEERWPRARIEESVKSVIGDSRDHKLWKGLARVLEDRSEFVVAVDGDPVEQRLAVFRRAAAMGPVALEPGPLGRPVANDVLTAVATDRGTDAASLAAALYADRPDEQEITSCDVPDADTLLARYDTALAQSVLLHATSVRVILVDPQPARLKQLFRWVKFHQLVHTAKRVGKDVLLSLDGPMSMFSQSTRYGLKLAQFLPALLLQDGAWTLEADIVWTRRALKRTLALSNEDALVSHLPDNGAWVSKEQQGLVDRWPSLDSKWVLSDRTEPLDLDGRSIVLPDLKFTCGKRTAWLEVVGYWRKDWLRNRTELLKRHGPGNLVLAVSRKLLGDDGDGDLEGFPGVIIPFKEVVPPKAVLEAIERVAK